ncbi:MAG: AgmX/PglI C-terminal domain-containing protein [Desulfatitalea sp.]|nr:AgmX/PglI C-terminal domain-containing protein [Desulfatitalea sp.]
MDNSILTQELAPLLTQMAQIEQQRETVAGQIRTVEAELEKHATARQQLDALQEVCDTLDRLEALAAGRLFWKGLAEGGDGVDHVARVRARVAKVQARIRGILDHQAALQAQIERYDAQLDFIDQAVREVYEEEEERQEEFVIEREASPMPYEAMIMPWNRDTESEKRLRQAVLVAILACFVFGSVISLVKIPIHDRAVEVAQIPKRLVKLVKKEPPRPIRPKKPAASKPKEEIQTAHAGDKTKSKQVAKKKDKPAQKAGGAPKSIEKTRVADGSAAARKKAERIGVLAYKETFKDLMAEIPVARLGTQARLMKDSTRVAGQARSRRSLVAIQATGGSSGGIRYAAVSRNVGGGNAGRIGGGIGRGGTGTGLGTGVGPGKVESTIAAIQETDRPVSESPSPGRTDEEIQIVFDRYKATLYRIYNRELRKDPTLRGKILLRISIETNGAVSMCKVESTDLGSEMLVAMIVDRILRFNFGSKEGVEKLTILYPIDFLPAAQV